MSKRATESTLRRAFASGDYANAYETTSLDKALVNLCKRFRRKGGPSHDYRCAFVLGFFASYELHEIPCDMLPVHEVARDSVAGKRCAELGLIETYESETET